VNFYDALAINPLLLYSLIAGLMASVVGGIVGSYVVVKRIVFVSGSISHSVLGGIGLCLWLQRVVGISWISPLYGALFAAILSALLIGWIHLQYAQRVDTAIAAIWSVGMATGVIFISQTPGYNVELNQFLLGNILWVSPDDLKLLGLLNFIVIALVIPLHKRFLSICFDEDQTRIQGLHVRALYLLLLILIAITIVVLIQVVGIILVMTMLTIPAAIANLFTGRLSTMMFLAVGINSLFCLSGTYIAYDLDWPVGATIALVAGASYCLGLIIQNRTR